MPQQFTYPAIEKALAELFEVPAKALPAFRARIRHLRNIGIPDGYRPPGRGKAALLNLWQAKEMGIALRLQELGMAPSMTYYAAREAAGEPPGRFMVFVNNTVLQFDDSKQAGAYATKTGVAIVLNPEAALRGLPDLLTKHSKE